ncbi:dynein axonemal intermediate chain 3 [Indicator indicator]|uniref:dynein axonemal intermediate chain 3 n=1 Tax=Indicator indicator TaxID=1002788 RepID=UPI0023DE779D|nr:dynein axonemal intermediate chain 3 [Indicator indicator]
MSGKSSLKSPKTSAKKQKGGKKAKESSKGKQTQLGEKDEVDLSMASIGHPEIFPLVFTTKTQEIFSCRAGEDVTEENCFKLIKKEDIIQDLNARAAVSDFHPIKKVVLEYPGEELLVVFDANFQYGQNFYLVASEEAKENLLKPPENEEEKEEENGEGTLEVHPYKPPVHKPWVSLGSEKEVEEESVKETVPKIKYMISQARRRFGAPTEFTDRNASCTVGSYVECASYQDKTFSIEMLEKDMGVQMVPKITEASTQTRWTYPKNASTQYFPRQLSNEEKESLPSKKLKEFLTSVHLRMEMALQQNEIMNAFFDDWKALAEDESNSGGKPNIYLKAYQSFTDPKNRTISCVCWHPTIYGIIAVSPREQLSYEEQVSVSDKPLLPQSVIVLWSFSDPMHPQLMLECPEDIYCFQFSLSDPNIIAGGCINGQVVLWDISEHEEKLQNAKTVADDIEVTAVNRPSLAQVEQSSTELPLVRYCALSSRQHSHTKTVTDMHCLPDYFQGIRTSGALENKAQTCVQLVTCSSDCSVLFWEIPAIELHRQPSSEKIRVQENFYMPSGIPDTSKHLDLCWKPLMKINLCDSGIDTVYGTTRISLRELHCHYKTSDRPEKNTSSSNLEVLESISTIFLVGTEDGDIFYSDWKGEINSDSAKPVSQKHNQTYTIHTEPINTLQESPFFKNIFLSIGGRNFAIWKEGVTAGPILQSRCSAGRNTSGHWSLTRPGVFFIGRDDGNIQTWDLMNKIYEPSHVQNVSNSVITFIRPWIASRMQHFLAVSDDLGVLHVLELSHTLSYPLRNERANVLDYFEREVKYLKSCEQEFQDYYEFQPKVELKCSWRQRGRKHCSLRKLLVRKFPTKMAPSGKERLQPSFPYSQKDFYCPFFEYDYSTENKEEMEGQENADYTVFLDVEKQILTDLGPVKGHEILSSSDA